MTLRELGIALISGGVCSLIAWVAGVREGLERASRMWRGRGG